jgi:predicted ester cyclase
MNRSDPARSAQTIIILAGLALPSLVASCAPPAETSWREEGLPRPGSVTIDDSISGARARRAVRAVQLFYAFWNTGKPEYAQAAVGPDFSDSTLSEGWRQGPEGLKAASDAFRGAVLDLTCTVEHLLVMDDRVVARLTFRGTHTGAFLGHPATGRPFALSAIEILRVTGDRIAEDQHVEDNYNSTLMRQLGATQTASHGRD